MVTDDRHILWWRLYAGQCFLAWRRIVCQQAQKILQNSFASLFYYIAWLGNGHRTVTFLNLWGFPEGTTADDKWYRVSCNLLEALFCKAFKTHHGMLDAYGTHLPSRLGWANIDPAKSPDRQIQHWAAFNQKQKKDVKSQRPHLAHIPFCGSLSAKVAAILDYAAISAAECTPMKLNNNGLQRPSILWSLESCGFTEANILLWTSRFKGFTEDHLDHLILSQPGVTEWHETLLRESQAKSILLCGPQAERTIKAVLAPKNLCRYTMLLRGFSYSLYHDTIRDRLFVRCPALPAEIWSISAYNSIRPYFCENSGVLGFIFRQARKERLGRKPMAAADMDDGVQLRLRRRNLGSMEAIKRIEENRRIAQSRSSNASTISS
ncbi:hypothetical protein BJX96DRAFT_181832 [Aspergillus floccosus]